MNTKVDSGELLEPFVERNASETNMYRRGSVIVISSVEDSHSGLLETFKPRSHTLFCIADDEISPAFDARVDQSQQEENAQDENTEETSIEDRKELPEATESTASRLEPFKSKSSPSASVVDYIWDSLPAVSWPKTSSSPPPPASITKSESCVELRDTKLLNSRWTTETEDFRRIQKEMRSTRVLTGGGAHAAMTQLLHQRRDAAAASRTRSTTPPPSNRGGSKPIRRRNNSFAGFPTLITTKLNLQNSDPCLQVNLSPFAFD